MNENINEPTVSFTLAKTTAALIP